MKDYYLTVCGKYIMVIHGDVHQDKIEKYVQSIPGFSYTSPCTDSDIELSFFQKQIDIRVELEEQRHVGTVSMHDIYVVILYAVYHLLQQKGCFAVHSVLVGNESGSFLCMGGFRSGKTTLAREFEAFGLDMLSADHTIVSMSELSLFALASSNVVRWNHMEYHIPGIGHKHPISGLLFLNGLASGGTTSIQTYSQPIAIVRKMWNAFTWVYNTPLETDGRCLSGRAPDIYPFLARLARAEIDCIGIRGDPREIARELSKRICGGIL